MPRNERILRNVNFTSWLPLYNFKMAREVFNSFVVCSVFFYRHFYIICGGMNYQLRLVLKVSNFLKSLAHSIALFLFTNRHTESLLTLNCLKHRYKEFCIVSWSGLILLVTFNVASWRRLSPLEKKTAPNESPSISGHPLRCAEPCLKKTTNKTS